MSEAVPEADEPADDCADAASAGLEGGITRQMLIVNKKGLHARATAKFVHCVEKFTSEITVTRCGETVGGTSIMGILTLGAGIGTTITVSARGVDADAAIDAIDALVAGRFGEDE